MLLHLSRALRLICLLLVLPLEAQVEGNFPVRRYGTDQGLGSEVVSAMVQDLEGRLWVGTEGGLCFFDGSRFSSFPGALPSGFVQSLSVDRDGSLWVATDGGLARIHHGKVQILGEANGIPRGSVQEVVRDAEGHRWILGSDGIRMEQSPDRFTIPAPWPALEPPSHLFADPSLNGAWATTSRTIWHWEDDNWIQVPTPRFSPGETLRDVAVDGLKHLWVRTSSALWRLPAEGPRTWIRIRMAGGYSHISKLSRDSQGWVWVDNTEGLWRVRGDRRVQFGHAQDDARGGMVDQEGGFWFRTDKGVLRVLGHTRWRNYHPPNGLPLDTTWQMVRDRQGRLWVGMDKGLWAEDGKRFRRILTGRFLNLSLGKGDSLWASGSPAGTVHLVNTRTMATRSFRIQALPVARITAGLTVDREGRPWLANEDGTVVRGTESGTGWSWELVPREGPPPRELRALMALPGGEVLALFDQAAAVYSRGTWHEVPDLLPELPYVAAVGPEGQVVIGYKTKPALTIHKRQGDTLVRTGTLDFAAGLKTLVVYSLGIGANGTIWVGTGRGLGCTDAQDPQKLRLLGSEDRIIHPECNQGALLVEQDRVWIGTPTGLMSHDPQPLPPAQALRPPVILSIRVAAKELDLRDSDPELPRDRNELEVLFMVPNYQIQDALIYEAKLSGVDADWIRPETPYLRYIGLPAGPHTLELRSQTREGVIGPVTRFHFHVRPAWWERWWVRVLGVFGLAGLVFILVKVRQARLEQRNRELIDEVARQTSALVAASKAKSAFLANMSHELRTPLNAILLYSEILQEDMKDPAQGGLRQDAGKIQSAGQHLLGLIDDILDMSKIEAGRLRLELQEVELHSFLRDLDATIRPLVEKNGNRFTLEILEVPERIHSDPTRLRQILVNLLSNSAKFTKDGQVLVKAWSEDDDLLLMVQDNGIGMTQSQQAKVFEEFVQADESTTRKYGGTGLGLTLVKKFTGLLGGSLALQSEPGKGTTFTLRLPCAGPESSQASGFYPVEPAPRHE
ncbi:MAG: ATP-binding protein [Geothrix sp.]|uniref:sensor histidine kinase n=1 Tax=Geothrix sp. TaxID=1962974 RepID=UPI003BAFCD54